MNDHYARCLHALEMALASQALTSAAPDDHRRRVIARQVYVFIGAFLECASGWRKERARTCASSSDQKEAGRRLKALRAEYAKAKAVRDHLASKRQQLGPGRVLDTELTLELWTSISAAAVTDLVDGAVETFDALVEAAGVENGCAIPSVPGGVSAALASLVPEGADEWLVMSTGSYAWARPGTMGVQLGGELGRRITHINDVDDQLRTAVALWPAVRGVQPYDRLVRSMVVAELSTLLDLAIGPPPPYPAKISPLIDLCTAENCRVGEEILGKLIEALTPDLRLSIKEGRNAVGAHIDIGRPFNELIEELDDLDMDEALIAVDRVREWLEFAALYEHALQLVLWDGRVTSSFERTPGPAPAPYESSTRRVPSHPAPEGLLESVRVVYVDSARATPAVAGAIAGRQRQLADKFGVQLQSRVPE